MKKHSLFIPEYVTENIYTITPFLLAARGYRGVVFDLDNTVAPYEHLQPDKATQDYFAALAEAGVQPALVSNNRRERIELFNERLGVFIVADAQKPSPRGVHRCIEAFGLPPEQVLHAYIPDVPGTARRKRAPGREGKLGVEGMPPEVLLEALRRAGAQAEDSPEPPDPITKTDL